MIANESKAIRSDLEPTVVDSDSREVSQLPNQQAVAMDNLRERFIPLKISNCSWPCSRDITYTLVSGAGSVVSGIGASEASNDKEKIIWAIASTICGMVAIALTIYGITIRRCPRSQQFWFRL